MSEAWNPKRFLVYPIWDKFLFAESLLIAAGHEVMHVHDAGWQQGSYDAFLVDTDCSEIANEQAVRRDLIRHFKNAGKPVAMYPHGAGASAQAYKDLYSVPQCFDRNVSMAMMPTESGCELLRAAGAPYPVKAVGWMYSRVRPMQTTAGEAVLELPDHVGGIPGRSLQWLLNTLKTAAVGMVRSYPGTPGLTSLAFGIPTIMDPVPEGYNWQEPEDWRNTWIGPETTAERLVGAIFG